MLLEAEERWIEAKPEVRLEMLTREMALTAVCPVTPVGQCPAMLPRREGAGSWPVAGGRRKMGSLIMDEEV